MLGRSVEHLGIEWREDDGEGPLPTLFQIFRGHAGEEQRVDLDVARGAGAAIEAREKRALTSGVEQIRIGGMRRDVAAFAAADRIHDWRAASAATAATTPAVGARNT